MRILITGVHGFVGTNLVKALSGSNTVYGLASERGSDEDFLLG